MIMPDHSQIFISKPPTRFPLFRMITWVHAQILSDYIDGLSVSSLEAYNVNDTPNLNIKPILSEAF